MAESPKGLSKVEKRALALAELISTEVTFVSEMQILVEVFVVPLRGWAAAMEAAAEAAEERDEAVEDAAAPAAASGDVATIFANLEQLLGFNKQFLNDLKDANERGAEEVLEVFLKAAPFFKMYSSYINNFDAARARIAALEAASGAFAAFIAACEAQKPCHGLRLRDFLIQPVQRIPRYRLLLETMLKYTPEDDPTHSKLERALTSMSSTANKINADVHLMEKRAKVLELQSEFGTAFVQASRLFVRDGMLLKICRNGPRQLRFVLFNDLLVYGEERGVLRGMVGLGSGEKRYRAKRAISLDGCFVVDSPAYGRKESSPMGETGFMVVSASKSFIVQASTAAEKDSWVQSIRGCMDELLAKAQERVKHKVELPGRRGSGDRGLGGGGGSTKAAVLNPSVWVINREGKSVRQGFVLPASAKQRRCGCLSFNELTMRRMSDGGNGALAGGGGVTSGGGGIIIANGGTGLANGIGGPGSAYSSIASAGSRNSLDVRRSLGRRGVSGGGISGGIAGGIAGGGGLNGGSGASGVSLPCGGDLDDDLSPQSVLNIAAMLAAAETARAAAVGGRSSAGAGSGAAYSGGGGAGGLGGVGGGGAAASSVDRNSGKRSAVQRITIRVTLGPGEKLGLRLRDLTGGGGVVVVGFSLPGPSAAAAAGTDPVAAAGPAAAAGVQPGDRIAKVAGSAVESCEQLAGALRYLRETMAPAQHAAAAAAARRASRGFGSGLPVAAAGAGAGSDSAFSSGYANGYFLPLAGGGVASDYGTGSAAAGQQPVLVVLGVLRGFDVPMTLTGAAGVPSAAASSAGDRMSGRSEPIMAAWTAPSPGEVWESSTAVTPISAPPSPPSGPAPRTPQPRGAGSGFNFNSCDGGDGSSGVGGVGGAGSGGGAANAGGGAAAANAGGNTLLFTPSPSPPPSWRNADSLLPTAAGVSPSTRSPAASMGRTFSAPSANPRTPPLDRGVEEHLPPPPPVPTRLSLPAGRAAAWGSSARPGMPPPVPSFVGVGTTPESSPVGGGGPSFRNAFDDTAATSSSPPKAPRRSSSLGGERLLSGVAEALSLAPELLPGAAFGGTPAGSSSGHPGHERLHSISLLREGGEARTGTGGGGGSACSGSPPALATTEGGTVWASAWPARNPAKSVTAAAAAIAAIAPGDTLLITPSVSRPASDRSGPIPDDESAPLSSPRPVFTLGELKELSDERLEELLGNGANRREMYLRDDEFLELFGMEKPQWEKENAWKQTIGLRKVGLGAWR